MSPESRPVPSSGRVRPFQFDRFQQEAVDALAANCSVIVAAPTGSGKTVVAERAVELALAAGRRAFYTAPIKALSNQKYVDFHSLYGPEAVGLLTGDNSINSGAPVVVMTTEVLRNMIYASSEDLASLDWVILDEVHYLQDPYRGPVWEEILIHAPAEVRFVCLSATVSNVEEIRSWIAALRGPTQAVVETERPVDLERMVCAGAGDRHRLRFLPVLVDGQANPEGFRLESDKRPVRRQQHGNRHRRARRYWQRPDRLRVLEELGERGMLPVIYFIFSRAGCADAAASVARSRLMLTTAEERRRIEEMVEPFVAGLSEDDRNAVRYDEWIGQMRRGVAAHHAGLLPPFKEAVEACFTEGLVKAVFATETLSLGINMPARSVVIEKLSKFTGEAHEPLSPASFTQFSGRAGRRGIDEKGYAVVLWHPRQRFGAILELVQNNSFPLRSAFRPSYNMTANLLARFNPAEARSILNRSLAQFQADRSVLELEKRILDARAKGERQKERVASAQRRRKRSVLAEEMESLAAVLRERGHLKRWTLLPAGEMLTGVYHENDLLITEMLLDGHFDEADEPSLAALLSCVTYESRGSDPPGEPATYPSEFIYFAWMRLTDLYNSIAATERRCLGKARTRPPDGGFVPAAYHWADGAELRDGIIADITPGDFVRNVKLICDLAQQLARVAPDSGAARTCRKMATKMLRGVVASSSLDLIKV